MHVEIPILSPTIEQIEQKVKENSYCYLQWDKKETPLLLDLFTASALVQAHRALKPENREKFARMVSKSKQDFLKVHNMVVNLL